MTADRLSANTSCLPNLPLQDAVGYIRRMGFSGITLLAFAGTRHQHGALAGFWFSDMSDSECGWLKELVSGFEQVALHAPFVHMPLFTHDQRVRHLSMERVKESIDAAGYLGAKIVIVHANARPNYPVQESWDEMVATFLTLGRYAEPRGVKIGVETGYPDVVEHFADLLEAIGHPAVGATLDVGHITRYVDPRLRGTPDGAGALNEKLIDLTRQLGPMILHCHLHDVLESDWTGHQAVGSGVLDFPRLLAELQRIGYQGMLELELDVDDAVRTLARSKKSLETTLLRLGRPKRAPKRRAA